MLVKYTKNIEALTIYFQHTLTKHSCKNKGWSTENHQTNYIHMKHYKYTLNNKNPGTFTSLLYAVKHLFIFPMQVNGTGCSIKHCLSTIFISHFIPCTATMRYKMLKLKYQTECRIYTHCLMPLSTFQFFSTAKCDTLYTTAASCKGPQPRT